MPLYQYTTRDAQGQPVGGTLEAAGAEQALAMLAAEGLVVDAGDLVEIAQAPDQPPDSGRSPVQLSATEAVDAAEVLAELAGAELPLAAGLRAVAEELPRRRVCRYLLHLAARLDRGVSLEEALKEKGRGVSELVRAAVSAGVQGEHLAEMLEQLVVVERQRREMRRRIVASLAYPAILVAVLLGLMVFVSTFVIQPMSEIYEDFDAELPAITQVIIGASHWWVSDGGGLLGLVILLAAVGLLALWIFRGTAGAQQVINAVPVLGPAWRWQGLTEFARMMSVLLDRGIPLPGAMRLVADGLRRQELAQACRASAESMEEGESLAACLDRHGAFPPSLKPLVQSGVEASRPAEGFRAAAEMYSRRTAVDLTLWEVVVPPILLLVVATFVGLLVVALLMPMIGLIQTLS